MSAATNGEPIPVENVFGDTQQHSTEQCTMEFEDMKQDAIGEIELMVGSSEIGPPRAYSEEEFLGRTFRDVYKTYPYVVLGIADVPRAKQAFALMIADVKAEVQRMIELGFVREHLVLQWRKDEKINVQEDWCRKCGGSMTIRTRLLVKPDRAMMSFERLAKDPAMVSIPFGLMHPSIEGGTACRFCRAPLPDNATTCTACGC